MLLNIEADEGRGDQQGSLLDRLLEGLVTKLGMPPTLRLIAKIDQAYSLGAR